jgi:hypothetical protein
VKYRICKLNWTTRLNGEHDLFYIEKRVLFWWFLIRNDFSSLAFPLGKDDALYMYEFLYSYLSQEEAENALNKYLTYSKQRHVIIKVVEKQS